ncbi:MAG: GNAT family N-acetyltransferase [Anaerolineales bacterium]|nr:GNAT family N-acetyltransferase [Anaerolineales bacterium]
MESTRAEAAVIRLLEERDLPALEWEGEYRHYRAVFRANFDDMQRGQRLLLVAVQGAQLVGQIFVQFNSAEHQYADGRFRGYLYALRVRPAWRGQGLGRRLVLAAEAGLLERHYQTAVIAVAKTNERARRLYLRLGYHVFADDPGVWIFTDADGREQRVAEPAWLMEKALRG